MNKEDGDIKYFTNLIEDNKTHKYDYRKYYTPIFDKRLENILNLISKLQKENEELKDYRDRTKHTIKIAKMHRKENKILKKVINLMAKPLAGLELYDFNRKEYFTLEDEGEVREYFYKKVEEGNENR